MLENQVKASPSFGPRHLSPGRLATLACLLEVSAPKPGNVHRGADFEDVTFQDFVVSAVVLGNVIDSADGKLGRTIFEAVSQTRLAVGSNTNLGTIMLLAPLSKAYSGNRVLSQASLEPVLAGLDKDDCRATYEAILQASPGGLGKSVKYDVHAEAPEDLLKAMQAAADRDLIARQYCNGFEQVFDDSLSHLVEGQELFADLSKAIVYAHVKMMSIYPDSLIQRKNDLSVAQHSQFLAQKAVALLRSSRESFWQAVSELDFWLRSDGHRRNPGTTADLIAAGIFVGLCNGQVKIGARTT